MSRSGQSVPATMQNRHEAIISLIEPLCRERLNDEYLGLCRRLAGMLAPQTPLAPGQRQARGMGLRHCADRRLGEPPRR